jgi:Fe2+ transport system protein FeoA
MQAMARTFSRGTSGTRVRLSQVPSGRPVMVRSLAVADARQSRHLETLGLVPGRSLVVERCAPFGGAVMVRVGESRYALGRTVCDQILVEPLAD